MWSWLEPLGPAGSLVVVAFLLCSVICCLCALVVAMRAQRSRQGVRLTYRFPGVRVDLKVDPDQGPE
jgi:hypothetical protein